MMIDKVGYINPRQPGNVGWNSSTALKAQADSIALSAEAKEKSELYQAGALVASASDVRADRIAELKQKIQDPAYINEAILGATADRIMEHFGL
jgi:negative regulator of flagellin synthesis FlgM